MTDDTIPSPTEEIGVAISMMPAAIVCALLADALFGPWYPMYRFCRRHSARRHKLT